MFGNNMSEGIKILLENTTGDFRGRQRVMALTEQESNAVNNTMIGHLYKSAIDKSHVDFDDIPESKGDITRYSGYSSTMETIRVLKEISAKSGHTITELEVIEKAISNITGLREVFTKGYALDKEFIILQYNTLVMAVIESVSAVISAYVDFVKRPDRDEITIIKGKDRSGSLSVVNLDKFNTSVKQGNFAKANSAIISDSRENFTGAELVVPIIILGAVLSIVPIVRELIFLFYFSRMKASDFLEHQASLLEINKVNVESSNLSPIKKKEVLKKQAVMIKRLESLSDKVKINRVQSERQAVVQIKKENKNWTLDDVQSQGASMDSTGFQLL